MVPQCVRRMDLGCRGYVVALLCFLATSVLGCNIIPGHFVTAGDKKTANVILVLGNHSTRFGTVHMRFFLDGQEVYKPQRVGRCHFRRTIQLLGLRVPEGPYELRVEALDGAVAATKRFTASISTSYVDVVFKDPPEGEPKTALPLGIIELKESGGPGGFA